MNENTQLNECWQLQVFVIKNIAKAKGITQDKIAEKTGIQRSNISRVFNLKYTPTIKTLNLIAQAVDSYIAVVGNGVDMDVVTSNAKAELEEFKTKNNE